VEVAGGVEHVGDAAAHPGGEVAAGLSEHHHGAAGHVLAAVVAAALHHGSGARAPHREALAGHAAEEGLARGGAVEHGVADDDVLLGRDGALARRVDDEAPAGESLADVIVGVSFQLERHSFRQECAEALPGTASELDVDRVVRQ